MCENSRERHLGLDIGVIEPPSTKMIENII